VKKNICFFFCILFTIAPLSFASSKTAEVKNLKEKTKSNVEDSVKALLESSPLIKTDFNQEEIEDLTQKLSKKDAKYGDILSQLIVKNDANVVNLIKKYAQKLTAEDKMRIAYNARNFSDSNITNLLIQWLEKSDDLLVVEYCIIGLKYQKSEVALNALKKFKTDKKHPNAQFINQALEKALEFMLTGQNASKKSKG
jgi:hypothetical protein